jgi:hypothetical protein
MTLLHDDIPGKGPRSVGPAPEDRSGTRIHYGRITERLNFGDRKQPTAVQQRGDVREVPEVEEVREKGIRDEKAANLKTGRKRQETRKSSPALLYEGYKGEGEKTIKNERTKIAAWSSQ